MTDPSTATITAARPREGPSFWARFRAPEWGLVVAIAAVLGLIYGLQDEHTFFGEYNLSNLYHNMALYGVLSVGAAVVIISGGIDLSIGSVVAISAVVSAKLMTEWLPILPHSGGRAAMFLCGTAAALSLAAGASVGRWRGLGLAAIPAVVVVAMAGMAPGFGVSQGLAASAGLVVASMALCLLVGAALGLSRAKWPLAAAMAAVVSWGLLSGASTDGALSSEPHLALIAAGVALTLLMGATIGVLHAEMINRFQLPPFIATLATMAGLRSLAIILSGNRTINVKAAAFRHLGGDNHYTIPIFAGIALVMSVIMGATVLGRHLYALGGNESAARLSGLPTRRLKTVAYATSALLAATGGMLFTGNTGQADSRMGVAYELFAITAAVVGGCSLSGGVGSIRGTVLGLILIQVVIKGTGLVVRDIDPSQIEGLVLGTVVVLAVAFNQRFRKRA